MELLKNIRAYEDVFFEDPEENPDTPRLLKGVPNVEVYIQQTPNYFRLDVSALQESSPFKDDRLRKAMSCAKESLNTRAS